MDGVDDLPVVAAWQVGAADAACKERVSGDEEFERSKVQADRALCVARGMNHLRGERGKANNLAVAERFVRRGGLRGRNTKPTGLLLHDLDLGQVVLIEQDGRARQPLELERAAYMVDVGVSHENLLQSEAQIAQATMNAANLVAWIDHDGLAGLLVAQNGAIALQRADMKRLNDHAPILRWTVETAWAGLRK